MRHLKQLGNKIPIKIPCDKHGYVGRECPNQKCLGYFKIKFRTGIPREVPCHCPYCGYTGNHSQFWTQDQLNYAKSVAIKKISGAIKKDVQNINRNFERSFRNSIIKMKWEFKDRHHPIHYYREKQLETYVICDNCTLEYAIYGIFSYCPDCGIHNSLQILNKNLELAKKELDLSESIDDSDLKETLMIDALENCVSAFDAFGRKICQINAENSNDHNKAKKISFQSISKTRENVNNLFGFDLSENLTEDEWNLVCIYFQKRHLFAHKMGVVDKKYLEITNDPNAIVDRKVQVNNLEIIMLIEILKKLGSYLYSKFQKQ